MRLEGLALWLAALAISVGWYLVVRLDLGGSRWITPDGRWYFQAGRRLPVPRPYTRRWLLPLMLGERKWAWDLVSSLSLIACGPLIAAYVEGEWWQRLAAVVLFVGCPGLFRTNVACPALVDACGFALALASSVLARNHAAASAGLALAAGACVERAPVFAAIFAGSPVPLLGLLAPAWLRKGAEAQEPWLTAPFRHALKLHAGNWLAWREILLPWGAIAVLAPLGAARDRLTLLAVAALVVGYGQLLIATDRARLYQWAAPPVIALAVRALPASSLTLLILIVHLFNPARPEGIDLSPRQDP